MGGPREAGNERADKLYGPFGKAPDALRSIETPRFHHAARRRGDRENAYYYAIALLVATAIHGLYDYLVMASGGRSFAFLFALGFVIAWAWRIVPSRA
jgi:hypothetical protein